MKLVSLFKISASLASLASVVIAPLSASALPYNSNTVYKVQGSNGPEVYVSASPGTRAEFDMGVVDRPAARLAGSCGEVRINPPSGGTFDFVKASGETIDPATLPTQLLPTCSGGSFSESRAENFKTPEGRIILVGYTPGQAVAIATPRAVTRRATVNGCGFARVRSSSSFTLPDKFNYMGTEYTVASLPDAGTPPVCRSTSGTDGTRVYTGYVPANW